VIEVDNVNPNLSCEIMVKNTLKELTITSELISIVKFPERLQKLVMVLLPASISTVTQRLPPTLRVLMVTVLSTYWSNRTPYALKNMSGLRYLIVRDFGMRSPEAKEIMQFGIANKIRILTLLKDDPKVNASPTRIRDSRP
jgi:hypothetical protein